jgi:hypothetical protein
MLYRLSGGDVAQLGVTLRQSWPKSTSLELRLAVQQMMAEPERLAPGRPQGVVGSGQAR